MEEINNFQQEPNENLYQAWERFKELLMKCPQHYLTEMQEVILFYNGLGIPTRQILDSRGGIPSKTIADAKVAVQEMAKYSQKWHNGTSRSRRSTETSDGLAAIQAQLNNLGREIKEVNEKVYAAQVGCKQCKGPHYTKDCPLIEEGKTLEEAYYTEFGRPFQGGGTEQQLRDSIKETMQILQAYSKASHSNNFIPRKEKDLESFTLPCFINNVCFDNALVDLRASVSVMPLSTYLNLELDMPEDIKVSLILERPFLSTSRAKIDVYKRKITLRIRKERIIFKSVKPASSLIKRVYMLSLRERMELDLEARLMRETLVINRSLVPLNGDYIKLNNLNKPFELRRNQGDDLIPTIKEGEVIEEFKTRDDELDTRIDDYSSYCDHDKKIHIDCAHNLKFSCMIGFKFTHVNFFPLLYVSVMSKKFYNSIMKDKMVYKGNNVIERSFMKLPLYLLKTFFVVTEFQF
ncbi:pyruvate dehydrogenase (acetyl-transferring) kinase, mitochondrial [Tanacetum coccineum]